MIDKSIQQYKTMEDLQAFCQAQHTTLTQLSKKIQRLEEERDHLKKLLEGSVTLINPNKEVNNISENDSEYICHIEISKLKNITAERELTYEETRKLSEYFKILNTINSRNKNVEKEVKDLGTGDLLKLVEGEKDK